MTRLVPLRLRLLAARHGPRLAVGLAVVGLVLAGVAGWTYTHPPTTEVTDRTHEQTIRSELHTGATVTGNTSLYDRDTRLVDQPVYLLEATPVLSLSHRTSVPDGRAVRVDQSVVLRYQLTHDGTTFWEESQVLAETETTTSSGEVTTNGTLDVRDLRARLADLRAEAGGAGTVRVDLLVSVEYETDRYSGDLSETVTVALSDGWYAVEMAPLERTHATEQTRTTPLPDRDPLGYVVPWLLGDVFLLAAAAVGLGSYRGFDREWLERRREEQRYDEWISTGRLPESLAAPERAVAVDSLGGLVDVAIDTNRRVIHDDHRDVYVVADGSTVYHHSPTAPASL